MATAVASNAEARLEDLKKMVEAEGGEVLAKSAVVGQDNNRLQSILDKEAEKKARLAAKRADRIRKKKEAKGIVDEEEEEVVEEKKGKKKNKKKNDE